mmetsp:Transcript_1608/g.4735  ORF Transcript_1608/g.4735 Transcript_1608/m.4735 type:complete len:227 (-) Transcript_1608:1230-1910(-)
MADEQVLTASLGAANDEWLLVVEPPPEQVRVPQHGHGRHQRGQHARLFHCLQRHVALVVGGLIPLEKPVVKAYIQWLRCVGQRLARPLEHLAGQVGAVLVRQVATQAAAHRQDELLLGELGPLVARRAALRGLVHVAEDVGHHAHPRGLHGQWPLALVDPLEGLVKQLIAPTLQLAVQVLWLPQDPRRDQWLDIDVLFGKEDHVQATDGGRRGEAQVVRLEDEIDV